MYGQTSILDIAVWSKLRESVVLKFVGDFGQSGGSSDQKDEINLITCSMIIHVCIVHMNTYT